MGRAEDLLADLEANGEVAIDQMILNSRAEDNWLDFKMVAPEWRPQALGDNNQNSLSRAIAGFANTDGGLIIWGVDCNPRNPHGDVARAKHPVDNLAAFVALLENAVSRCTEPVHRGGVRSFGVSNQPGRGFAVTYVPQSQDTPHRDLGKKDYPVRSGASFVAMSHSVLAGMFGRRPSPVLWLSSNLHGQVEVPPLDLHSLASRTPQGFLSFKVRFCLRNVGKGIGRDFFVMLEDWIVPEGCELQLDAVARFMRSGSGKQVFSAITEDGFRLAPFAQTACITAHFKFLRQKFKRDLMLPITFGCEGATIETKNVYLPASVLNEINEAQIKGHQQFSRLDFDPGAARMLAEHLELPEWRRSVPN